MNAHHFPEDAFLPARSLGQKLAALFNARAYRPADLRSIRTSVYYSNFELANNRLRYVVTTGQALRCEDGKFIVYPSQSQITEDPIRKIVSINAGYQDRPHETVICDESEVILKLKELDRALKKEADYALAFPAQSIVNLRNDLHLDAAILLFHNRRCTHDEIIQQQQSARYHRDLPALNR